jgi:hypothetical protein
MMSNHYLLCEKLADLIQDRSIKNLSPFLIAIVLASLGIFFILILAMGARTVMNPG